MWNPDWSLLNLRFFAASCISFWNEKETWFKLDTDEWDFNFKLEFRKSLTSICRLGDWWWLFKLVKCESGIARKGELKVEIAEFNAGLSVGFPPAFSWFSSFCGCGWKIISETFQHFDKIFYLFRSSFRFVSGPGLFCFLFRQICLFCVIQ